MKERSYIFKFSAVVASTACMLSLSSCTKTSFQAAVENSTVQSYPAQIPSQPATTTQRPTTVLRKTELVKRTQTTAEIELLFQRYRSASANELPNGLRAIMRQMVDVPETSFTQTTPSRSAVVKTQEPLIEEDSRKFIDVSNQYLFADKKPLLPLSGGFLNNPATQVVDSPTGTASPRSNEIASPTPDTRARLERPSPGMLPAKARIVDAGEQILIDARKALDSAGQAVERGFGRLAAGLEEVEQRDPLYNEPERSYEEDPSAVELRAEQSDSEQDEESEERVEVAELEQTATEIVDRSLTNEELKTDVRKELQSAKAAFLSRFDRNSYSVIRETAVLVTILLAFIFVGWVRLVYERANRRK